MAGAFSVPKRSASSLKGGDQGPIPAGPWIGSFEEFEVRGLPDWSQWNNPGKSGYESTDGEELSVQIGGLEYAESVDGEPPSVGNRKYFLNLTLRDGDRTVETVDVEERQVPYYKLQRSAKQIANLAIALEWVEYVGDMVLIRDGFIDALRTGAFKGDKIGFVIYHRSGKAPTNPDGSKGEKPVYDEIETFFGAA